MIDLARLSPVAGLMTVPARWPRFADRVRRQFAPLGVRRIIALVNSPDDAALQIAADRDNWGVRYDGPPPATFRGRAGSWYQTLAWLDLIRLADRSEADSILILEDDALLTPEAAESLAGAKLPEVWDCLYLGAMHGYGATEPAGPNLLRINGSKACHAVLYHRRAFARILSWAIDRPSDQLMADHLHPEGLSFALWPQAVIQAPGLSVITGEMGGDPTLWATRGRQLNPAS